MIKARPKYPTDLYGTIYIDKIQKALSFVESFRQYFLLMLDSAWKKYLDVWRTLFKYFERDFLQK
jgi:hypothetical protein